MNFQFSDFFKFDRFFTPVLIRGIYLLYIIGGALWLVYSIIQTLSLGNALDEYSAYGEYQYADKIMGYGILGSILVYVIGLFLLRLLLEGIIVVFNIYGNLRAMKATLEERAGVTSSQETH